MLSGHRYMYPHFDSQCNAQRGTVCAVAQLASQNEQYKDIFASSTLMCPMMRTLACPPATTHLISTITMPLHLRAVWIWIYILTPSFLSSPQPCLPHLSMTCSVSTTIPIPTSIPLSIHYQLLSLPYPFFLSLI